MTVELVVRAANVARTFGTGPNAVVAIHSVDCEVGSGDLIVVASKAATIVRSGT